MKTYHLSSEAFHKKISQQDLTPFVKYSLNKKRRWETKCDLETISQLEEAYCNMDVLVFDRVLLYYDPFWCELAIVLTFRSENHLFRFILPYFLLS